MGIFKRLQDIISANLGEMVSDCEDPEPMLRQAIAEMEQAIGQAKRETARAMADEKIVRRELADNERQGREWQGRAEKAVRGGDDAQARQALSRRQEYEKVAAALADQAHATGEASQTLRRQLEAMQAKLAEAKRQLGTLAARQKAAAARQRSAAANFDLEAFAKFERLSERVARTEAEADALRELEASLSGSPPAEPEPAPAAGDLDAELEALKKKLKR